MSSLNPKYESSETSESSEAGAASAASESVRQTARYRWWPVLLCLFVLMVATISPPEDFKASRFGTQSILPPVVLKLMKLVGRGLSLLVLTYCLLAAIGKPRFWGSLRPLIPLFVFAAFAVLSVAWSAEKSTSLVQAGSLTVLLLMAWLISLNWSGEKDTSRLLGFASVVMMVISLGLIAVHFAVPPAAALTRDSSGIFHSTMSGATASLALVTLFSCRMIWGWAWTKQLLVPGAVIHLASMLIGGNRLSLAMAVLVCGLAFCLASEIASLALAVFCATTLGIAYVCVDPGLLLSDGLVEKLNEFVAQGQTQRQIGSLSGRVEMWEKIWESYQQSPWIGHGYFVTSSTGRIFVWDEWGNWTAHNVVLQLLVTLGIVGVVLFLIGIGNIAVRVLGRLGAADQSQHRMALLLTLVGIWFLGWGMLNESFFGPLAPESVMFGLMLGLGAALIRQDTNSDDTTGRDGSSLILPDGEPV